MDEERARPGEPELAAMRTIRDELSGLNLVAEAFPAWDIAEVFGGYRAVPQNAECITASSLETLSDKLNAAELRKREEQHREYTT